MNKKTEQLSSIEEQTLLAIADIMITNFDLFELLDECCHFGLNSLTQDNKKLLIEKGVMEPDGTIPEVVKRIVNKI